MSSLMPPDSMNAMPDANSDQPVYRGGSITGIRDLAERLGARAEWDPSTGTATVNGKVIPWATNLNGNPHGSVHDIVNAAGGHVVRETNGMIGVYSKPAPLTNLHTGAPPGVPPFRPNTGDRFPTTPGFREPPPAPAPVQSFPWGPPQSPLQNPWGSSPTMTVPAPLPHGGGATPPPQPQPQQPPPSTPNPLQQVVNRGWLPAGWGTTPVVGPSPAMASPATSASAPVNPLAVVSQRAAPPPTITATPAPSHVPAGAMPDTPAGRTPAAVTPAQSTPTTTEASPALGNGTPTTAEQSNANDEKLKDPAYVKSEIERTKAVILARQKAGLDTTAQATYLAKLTAIDIYNQAHQPQHSTQQAPAAQSPAASGQGAPPAQGSAQPASSGAPAFNYQPAPIDYKALQDRATLEAQMWADPQYQALKDQADLARERYQNEAGYVKGDLLNNILDLRAGEGAREQRISELMNQRGDALYGSGVHLGAIRDQQLATQDKEFKLTQAAQGKLEKLTDSLNLNLKSLANKQTALALQQSNKALLTLQQLADKAESSQFQNRKLAWQMYVQGSQLDMQGQKMANDLWLNIQRIKSADERAAATNDLKRWIATGQLEQKWTEMMGVDSKGNPTRQSLKDAQDAAYKQAQLMGYTRAPDGSLVRTLDGQKFDLSAAQALSKQTGYVIGLDGKPITDESGNPVRTLAGAQFDWDKQKFIISENWKESYEGALLKLKQDGAISDAAYKQAQLDIQKGNLSIQLSKLLGTVIDPSTGKPMLDDGGNPIPVADSGSGTSSTAQSNAAWKGVLGDLGDLIDPVKSASMSPDQKKAAAQAIVSRWLPQLSAAEQTSLKNWLKANGLM